MAPRRGGGSGSHGGSVSLSCPACNEPLYLDGYSWKDARTNALFALSVIALFVLVACLLLSTRFKWERQVGLDKLRRKGYVIAASSAFIYYALSVSDTVLHETNTVTTNIYNIITIFFYLSWKLFELITLGIILRTLCEQTRSKWVRRLVGLHVTALVILGILATAVFAIQIYSTVERVRNGYYYEMMDLWHSRNYLQLTYNAVIFLVAVYACVVSAFTLIRERTKGTLIMTAVVIPALFLRTLVALISYSIFVDRQRASMKAVWGSAFIEVLTTMTIFLGLAIIACLRPSSKLASVQQPVGYNQQYNPQYTQQTGSHY